MRLLLPRWLTRLFHEPKDPEVIAIKKELDIEAVRHSAELGKISQTLAELGVDYDKAEQERLKQ